MGVRLLGGEVNCTERHGVRALAQQISAVEGCDAGVGKRWWERGAWVLGSCSREPTWMCERSKALTKHSGTTVLVSFETPRCYCQLYYERRILQRRVQVC